MGHQDAVGGLGLHLAGDGQRAIGDLRGILGGEHIPELASRNAPSTACQKPWRSMNDAKKQFLISCLSCRS